MTRDNVLFAYHEDPRACLAPFIGLRNCLLIEGGILALLAAAWHWRVYLGFWILRLL